MTESPQQSDAEIEQRLSELAFYHSIDIRPGLATKGWWDLRHALTLMPFPNVQGKRCLDIGTWDGFYAFELERRGAAEVVALDVEDLSEVDYPPEARADTSFNKSATGLQPRNAGFHLLHQILGSKVQFRPGNIYDLDPDEIGAFDVIVLGSLLVHLRDPVRALDTVRRVLAPDGVLLSVDYVHPSTHLLARRKPIFELRGEGTDFQWWLASDAGYRQLLKVGGFTIDQASPMFLLRPGALVGGALPEAPGLRGKARWVLKAALSRDRAKGGHLHRAYLAHRRF
jgi:tRNA (mo5U34)-methyltransferase